MPAGLRIANEGAVDSGGSSPLNRAPAPVVTSSGSAAVNSGLRAWTSMPLALATRRTIRSPSAAEIMVPENRQVSPCRATQRLPSGLSRMSVTRSSRMNAVMTGPNAVRSMRACRSRSSCPATSLGADIGRLLAGLERSAFVNAFARFRIDFFGDLADETLSLLQPPAQALDETFVALQPLGPRGRLLARRQRRRHGQPEMDEERQGLDRDR